MREEIERRVRALTNSGDYDGAVRAALGGFGAEIYGFIVAVLHNEDHAADVFSIVSESLWRGLPTFAWSSTFRTWAYTIARNATIRFRADVRKNERGAAPIGEFASQLAAELQTRTRTFMKTENKDHLARIRESLPADERLLLVLRLDRELSWTELAEVMRDGDVEGVPLDPETRKREAARLRKRFQLVKEKLIALGRQEGLLPPAPASNKS